MFSWTDPESRPIIVAHRGISARAPENTLAAFALAINEGADAIELDVRMTADGKVAVLHDGTLKRTTDGRGNIRTMRVTELKEFSAGSWFASRFASETVPLLDEVFELAYARSSSSRNPIGINIEIKEPPLGARYDIVAGCLRIARKHHALKHILITSFHHPYIRRAKQLEPKVATGVLHHPVKNFRMPSAALAARYRADYVICGKSALRKRMAASAHDHGVLLGTYTVNRVATLRKVLRAGVDMIFTDDPAVLQPYLATSLETNE